MPTSNRTYSTTKQGHPMTSQGRPTTKQVRPMTSFKENEEVVKVLNANNKLAIICFATFVAFFDFTIFIFGSNTLSAVFFPIQKSSWLAQIQVITLFATGFLARPIGAWLIGRYGDRNGRRAALHISMTLLLLTTLTAMILPTYIHLGKWAPLLLLLVRLIQGGAFAAQLILGFIYLIESLPQARLALATGLNSAALFLGAVTCSNLYSLFNGYFTASQMLIYGWRLMFLTSAILSLIAFYLVRKLPETPLFLQQSATAGFKRQQTLSIKSNTATQTSPTYSDFNRLNAILITVFLTLTSTSMGIINALLLPKLLTMQFNIEADLLHTANTAGMTGLIIGLIFYGWLSDKIGAARVLMIAVTILGLVAMLFYNYCANSDLSYITPFYALLGFTSGISSVAIFILIRLFPAHQRLTLTGLIFNLVIVFTGAILPFALVYATNIISLAPALYIVFICICAFIIGLYIDQSPNIYELEALPELLPNSEYN